MGPRKSDLNASGYYEDYEPVRPNMTSHQSREYGEPSQTHYPGGVGGGGGGGGHMSYNSEDEAAEEV